MENQLLLIFSLITITFSVPLISSSMVSPPSIQKAYIEVVVNNDQETSHKFNLYIQNDSVWTTYFHFGIYTDAETTSDFQDITIINSDIGKQLKMSLESTSGGTVKYIHCVSDNSDRKFVYDTLVSAIFSINENEHIICTFDNIKPQTKNPVLIVPGVIGTELFDGSEKLWPDVTRMLIDPSDNFMDSLQFGNDLKSLDSLVSTGQVLGKEVTLDYSDGLINEFTNQGYVEGQDLFTFPYDWRYGVSGKYLDGTTNADLLAAKIQDILKQTGSDKVDIVAHSLGGLIVKEYAMEHPADNHIGKAVFVGVPNTGSLVAVKALIQGDNFGVLGLSDSEMKKISANLPASYDLLPSQEYYNNAGSFVSLIDNTADDSLGAFSVSENTKKTDLDYIQFKSFLTGEHSLNSQALANAENLHTPNFDNFDLRTAGIDLYAIDGCKTGTVSNFQEAKTKNILGQETTGYNSVGFNVGDGTVPLESATNLPISQGNKYYALVSEHGKMLSENGIRQEIVNLISGSSLDAGNNLITQDISKCQLNGKAISVFSPVNIFVTDQNGNRLGLADDGSIINEIPNADFEIMGDHKFIYLPQDEGEIYTINLTGTDTGTFTIKNQNIQNSQIASAEVFSDLPVTTALAGQININPADNTTTLSLNSSPSPILPDSTSTGQQVSDYVPPAPQPVATTGGGGLMPIPKTQNQNILPSQISLVQTVPPARQVILPPAKKPTPILKKTAKQIIQPKKIAAAIPEIKPAKAITIPIQPNPFLASLGSFGNSIMGFLNKLWLILKNKVK